MSYRIAFDPTGGKVNLLCLQRRLDEHVKIGGLWQSIGSIEKPELPVHKPQAPQLQQSRPVVHTILPHVLHPGILSVCKYCSSNRAADARLHAHDYTRLWCTCIGILLYGLHTNRATHQNGRDLQNQKSKARSDFFNCVLGGKCP